MTLGYASEIWTMDALAKHIRNHCQQAGYPSLSRLVKGTVSKILSKAEIRPHKIEYYLARRDPEFDLKMIQVLHVYKEVELLKSISKDNDEPPIAILSYDEKPGIQAIKNIAPDLPAVSGKYRSMSRCMTTIVGSGTSLPRMRRSPDFGWTVWPVRNSIQ